VLVCGSSENQQFLKDVTLSVLEGRGVGFLKQGRVKKLMEDENYRNFVVSRLNTALEKKLTDENQHLDDVVSNSSHCHQLRRTCLENPKMLGGGEFNSCRDKSENLAAVGEKSCRGKLSIAYFKLVQYL